MKRRNEKGKVIILNQVYYEYFAPFVVVLSFVVICQLLLFVICHCFLFVVVCPFSLFVVVFALPLFLSKVVVTIFPRICLLATFFSQHIDAIVADIISTFCLMNRTEGINISRQN